MWFLWLPNRTSCCFCVAYSHLLARASQEFVQWGHGRSVAGQAEHFETYLRKRLHRRVQVSYCNISRVFLLRSCPYIRKTRAEEDKKIVLVRTLIEMARKALADGYSSIVSTRLWLLTQRYVRPSGLSTLRSAYLIPESFQPPAPVFSPTPLLCCCFPFNTIIDDRYFCPNALIHTPTRLFDSRPRCPRFRSLLSIHSFDSSAAAWCRRFRSPNVLFVLLMCARTPPCRNPFDPKERVVKRMIGADGDWVRPRGNRHNVLRVPEGCCWVEGDNHGVSEDSNQFGPVSLRGWGGRVASAGEGALFRARVIVSRRFQRLQPECL